MFLIILGVLDALASLALLLLSFGVVFKILVIGAAIYLGFKGLLFITDIASIFDVITAVVLILSLSIVLPKFIFIVLLIILVQKAFFSFLGN